MNLLRCLFDSIRSDQLTLKPSKSMIGVNHLGSLDIQLEKGQLSVEEDNVEYIKNAPRPTTKKPLRSVLGLKVFYRKFIKSLLNLRI